MSLVQSPNWKSTDKPIYLVNNFTDIKNEYKVTVAGKVFPNNSIPTGGSFGRRRLSEEMYVTGQNLVQNITNRTHKEDQRMHLIIGPGNWTGPKSINMASRACIVNCTRVNRAPEEKPVEAEVRYWSNPQHWTSGEVPAAGDDVEIESGWNMILDIPETPELQLLRINGILTF